MTSAARRNGTTTDSRRFAATVKDPATPAGLLNGLAAARQPR